MSMSGTGFKIGVMLAVCAAGLAPGFAAAVGATYVWRLPRGFAAPVVPADNPMSAAKVELGRRLFYDTRLSSRRL